MQSLLTIDDVLFPVARNGIAEPSKCYRHAPLPRHTEDLAAQETPILRSFVLQDTCAGISELTHPLIRGARPWSG